MTITQLWFPFLQGFLICIALSISIGPQVLFIFNQMLKGRHLFGPMVIFFTGEVLLVGAGVLGVGAITQSYPSLVRWMTILAVGFLGFYGLRMVYVATKGLWKVWPGGSSGSSTTSTPSNATSPPPQHPLSKQHSFSKDLLMAAIVTYGNPQVYLDTIVFIGAAANTFPYPENYAFGIGSLVGSLLLYTFVGLAAPLIHNKARHPVITPLVEMAIGWGMIVLAYYMFIRS